MTLAALMGYDHETNLCYHLQRGALGEQLALCLHKSVASIRSDATCNPCSLPPLCRLPGTKRLLWRAEDVDLWLAEHVIS